MDPVGITDIGKQRLNNEDSLFVSGESFHKLPNLFIVADGMGGHNAGEVASAEAISLFTKYCETTAFKKKETLDHLIAGCVYANDGVLTMAESNINYGGMGTTFSVCVKDKKKLYIAHIGDSRIYAVLSDGMRLLTCDHTYVNEMQKLGQLTEEQAKTHPRRNMLTKVLGVERGVKFDGQAFDLTGCLKILMCSDGLTNMLTDGEIFNEITGSNADTANRLIDAANAKGGADNITIIIFDATETVNGGGQGAAGTGRHNKRTL